MLPYIRRVREATNTHEPCLDLSHVIGVLSVHVNIVFVHAVFLLVFWIMISHIPACTRLAFYKTIVNIFTSDSELKDISELYYWDMGQI